MVQATILGAFLKSWLIKEDLRLGQETQEQKLCVIFVATSQQKGRKKENKVEPTRLLLIDSSNLGCLVFLQKFFFFFFFFFFCRRPRLDSMLDKSRLVFLDRFTRIN